MPGAWGLLRRRILTPSIAQTNVERRGFHVKDDASRRLLETVGRQFLTGYRHAVEAGEPAGAEPLLETIERSFRGFAYEGATMGFAMLDALSPLRHDRVPRFLQGRGGDHVYMAQIGVGWAFARLPRIRWRVIAPADPLLRCLVLDGSGSHQASFRTEAYVHRQHQETDFPWPGNGYGRYANRVIDQGIGRAMWFVGGTDVDRVVELIGRFDTRRHSDLWSGAGLAATYAGGVDASELERFWTLAGEHRPAVAQAAAFAAKARVLAGLVTEHTELATSIFCGASPEAAAAVTDEALVELPPDGAAVPAFEVWGARSTGHFARAGKS